MERSRTIHVVPEEAVLLELKTKFPCTVEECGQLLPNYGALRMHLVKTHKCFQSEEDQALAMRLKKVNSPNYVYHCPVQGCPKSRLQGDATGAAFTSMKLLKQHYGKLHAEKKFKCVKCERGFGLDRDRRRHEETCGMLLKCLTCGCPYSTAESLLTHCRRKGHTPPVECNSKKKTKKKTDTAQPQKALTQPSNIFVINVLPSLTCSTDLSQIEGFRQILPKPIILQTVPVTSVNMAADQVVDDPRDFLCLHNINTQTDSDRVEQGTSMTGDFSQICDMPATVQRNHMEDNVRKITGCGRWDGDMQDVNHNGNRLGIMPYFPSSFPEKMSTATTCNVLVNASTQHMGTYRSNNRPSSNMTQNSYLSQVVDKNSQNVFSLQDTMCLTKGMQTLMSLPLRSELSIAVAETQTSGDYILKQAMTSADINLNKESKGSQVSPRSKFRGERGHVYVNSQSCQTSRFSEQKTHRLKKCKKSANKECVVNSVINKPKRQWSHRCTANANLQQVSRLCNNCECVVQCTCVTGPHTCPIEKATPVHRLPYSIRKQRTSVNSELYNPCFKHNFDITDQDMLIDGPQDEGLQAVPGHLVDFDDFADHQTQTMGLLEELNSLAATISTQTSHSYLAQPSTANTETEATNTSTQHSHTQTFVSAFSLSSNRASQEYHASEDDFPFVSATGEHSGGVVSSGQLYNIASNAQSCQNTPAQRPSVTFTNSNVQTSSTDFLNLLDTGIQADSGPGTTIQTQTDVDEMWELFCHNIETQTADDFLQELGFSDIQIQTNMDLECIEDNSSTVETQTMWHAMSTACGGSVEQSDMQTQTLFPTSTGSTTLTFDTDLTDSHTQTPWEDITALILDDL